jgi:hypothetical protein
MARIDVVQLDPEKHPLLFLPTVVAASWPRRRLDHGSPQRERDDMASEDARASLGSVVEHEEPRAEG